MRALISKVEIVYILSGTGWGLADSEYEMADFIIEPIRGVKDYNHLGLRSVVAITLDRLLSPLFL